MDRWMKFSNKNENLTKDWRYAGDMQHKYYHLKNMKRAKALAPDIWSLVLKFKSWFLSYRYQVAFAFSHISCDKMSLGGLFT